MTTDTEQQPSRTPIEAVFARALEWQPFDPRRNEVVEFLHVACELVGAEYAVAIGGPELDHVVLASTTDDTTVPDPGDLTHVLRLPLRDTERQIVGELALVGSGIPSDDDLRTVQMLATHMAGTVSGAGHRGGLRRGRSLGIVVLSDDGLVRAVSPNLAASIGLDYRSSTGIQTFDLVHPDDLEAAATGLANSTEYPGEKFPLDVRLRVAGGAWAPLELTALTSPDLSIDGVVLEARETADRSAVDMLIAHQSRILSMIGRGAPLSESLSELALLIERQLGAGCCVTVRNRSSWTLEPIAWSGVADTFVTGLRGVSIAADSTTCGVAAHRGQATRTVDIRTDSGWSTRSADFSGSVGLFGPDPAAVTIACWSTPIPHSSEAQPSGTIAVYQRAGEPPRADAVRLIDACASIAALAIERAEAEAELTYEANHDSLTGLPNRACFLQRLDAALARRAHRQSTVTVLFVDLDRFKVINDALGHSAGDELLVSASRRLIECLGSDGMAARFGGDEFTILYEAPTSVADVAGLADRLVRAFRDPLVLGDRDVVMTLSVGVAAPCSDGSASAETMLRQADTAMYAAKEAGRNRYQVFDSVIASQAVARLEIEQALFSALERGELSLHFQPEVSMSTRDVTGVEALMRWNHTKWGPISPAEFIPVAEESGEIIRIGEWALNVALAQVGAWTHGLGESEPFTMWVNISTVQLMQAGFVDMVRSALKTHGVKPRRLGLEITESALMADSDGAAKKISALKLLGVKVAIDDFGTGYSSLAYLRRLAVDIVKIDQSFVRDLDDPDGVALVEAIINMANAVGCATIAEGVETAQQYRVLDSIGCDIAQGYGLARPVAPMAHRPSAKRDIAPLWRG